MQYLCILRSFAIVQSTAQPYALPIQSQFIPNPNLLIFISIKYMISLCGHIIYNPFYVYTIYLFKRRKGTMKKCYTMNK